MTSTINELSYCCFPSETFNCFFIAKNIYFAVFKCVFPPRLCHVCFVYKTSVARLISLCCSSWSFFPSLDLTWKFTIHIHMNRCFTYNYPLAWECVSWHSQHLYKGRDRQRYRTASLNSSLCSRMLQQIVPIALPWPPQRSEGLSPWVFYSFVFLFIGCVFSVL